MRALTMTGPADDAATTTVVEMDVLAPGPGEISIDVAFGGLNFIDVMARRGDPGYAARWPWVPGLEVAGTVRAVGTGVDESRIGERVAAFTSGGGLAEVALVPASIAVPVPDRVALDQAAAAPLMLATAVLLLGRIARLRPGESVLMHSAAGGVGSAVALLAGVLGNGARVGTVGHPAKIAAGLAAGWHTVAARGDGLADILHEALPGGADVILDPTGTAHLELDLDLAAPGARVVLFGNAGGGTPGPLPPLGRLIGGNVALIGFSMSRFRASRPEMVAEALRDGLELLASERIDLPVTVVESLDSVAATHDLLAAGRGQGKYVVRIKS